MEHQVQQFTQSMSIASLLDILLCTGIIFAIGIFLWMKGRFSISPKR